MPNSNVRVSFEFFPPQTEKGRENLLRTSDRLNKWKPEYFSVTYGAGGSTRDRTFETITALCQHGLPAAPHYSMGSDPEDSVRRTLLAYHTLGIKRIVALRGDIPSGLGRSKGAVKYAANLVQLIRKHFPDRFEILVAAYPEVHPDAASPERDLEYFKTKVAAGADTAITQYFYNADAYFDFVNRTASVGINVPIIPGIMPITNYANLVRFSDGCGAEIPRWIRKRLEQYKDDEVSLLEFGCDVVTALCERLIANGAPGLHFYTLNRAEPSSKILERL